VRKTAPAPPPDYGATAVTEVVTLPNKPVIAVLNVPIEATAATATNPTIRAYSTKSCPCVSCHKYLQNSFIDIGSFPI
jgi:hypothetical protein